MDGILWRYTVIPNKILRSLSRDAINLAHLDPLVFEEVSHLLSAFRWQMVVSPEHEYFRDRERGHDDEHPALLRLMNDSLTLLPLAVFL
jgi:hypothetical protein